MEEVSSESGQAKQAARLGQGGDTFPAWIREVDVLLPVARQMVLTGNIEDFHVATCNGRDSLMTAAELVISCCDVNGFDFIYSYDPVDGISLEFERTEGAAEKFFGPSHLERSTSATLGKMADLMRKAMLGDEHRVAILMKFASRMWRDELHAGPDLRVLFTLAEKLAHTEPAQNAPRCRSASIASTVFWFAGQDVAAPRWLTYGDAVRTISVPPPELATRRAAAAALLPGLQGYGDLPKEQAAVAVNTFARLSDGMTLRDLDHILQLAVTEDVPATDIDVAIRSLRFGVSDSPWRDAELLGRIAGGEPQVSSRVLGQPAAVRRSLDVLVRAATGLTGAHAGTGTVNRPQGILFFAGPTGVGKTELAKALAELLFGVDDAYTRFDMSEFSAEHSEARLIGAPPGYVGFGAGGELTNAVRQKPFSILLFDEIEKAHPRILDKFLQILEDGRLTDGAGDTVYFSETVIIFTSNLGTYRPAGAETNTRVARRGDPYEITRDRVHEAITHHFTEELQRPEILNRIGNNIVVFDFISEPVAQQLATKYIDGVLRTVRAGFGLTLSLAPAVTQTITESALENLDFGGRGVSSAVEATFVNPLARALSQLPTGLKGVTVTGLQDGPRGWELTLA
ncbi:AAA family ATPase [Arthrobacter sp. NPDC058097]|uniref:AAA family ATPase n=1 Tax=Arthrobacter sp. NPDC058097 TaxID=3346340 RepID=UPI0036DDA2E2